MPSEAKVRIERVVIRRVVCAACRNEHLIVCGARHFDRVMNNQIRHLRPAYKTQHGSDWEQGFIDQFGKFMDRQEAMQVAKDAGQEIDIKRGCGGDATTLYSEGLY